MQYFTDLATGQNQLVGNDTLSQLLTAFQAYAGSANEPGELTALQQIVAYLASQATATKQDTGNTSLASILSIVATAAKQDTSNTALASILSGMATASAQTTGNTSLASILSAMATAAKQDIGNTSLASIDSKLSASSAVLGSVSQSVTSQVLLAANGSRKGLYFYNNSGQKAYVAFAATASSTVFTMIIPANTGYEGTQVAVYKGVISVIFAGAGSGTMQTTEIT